MQLPEYDLVTGDNGYIYACFRNGSGITRDIRLRGSYQKDLIQVCLNYLSDKSMNVLDIGANMGSFTIPVAKNIQGTVYSFEVQRHVFTQLCTNIFLNRLFNVYPTHGLLCENSQESFSTIPVLDYSYGTEGVYSLNSEHIDICKKALHVDWFGKQLDNVSDKVRRICVDDLDIENIGFIKIDVEGAELSILLGMKNTLQKNNYPPILFECSTLPEYSSIRNRLFDFLSENYNIFNIENNPQDFLALRKSYPEHI
jgi:hypothetical protein